MGLYGKIIHMKKTLHIDETLLQKARAASRASTDTEAVRMGLEALVRHAAYERLRALRGAEPAARDVPRRRQKPPRKRGAWMVLVDTSVWIRFLKGTESYATELERLLSNDEVLGHDFVYGELLIGDRGGRSKFLDAYKAMHQAALVSNSEVVEFVKTRKIHARGIGWIDAHLLASAIIEHSALWTADRPLAAVAQDMGIAYRHST
jgi:predicted nucleic acid-binding protein/Arc/MetJ family transcription regulator